MILEEAHNDWIFYMQECKFKECLCKENEKWRINAPDYGNCFWTYLAFNKRHHTLKETAELLGLTISVITTTEKKAIDKIAKRFRKSLKK